MASKNSPLPQSVTAANLQNHTIPMKPKNRHLFTSLITVALATGAAHAADGTWNSTSSGTWNSATSPPWDGSTIADGSGSTAFFNTVNPTADVTVTLGGDRTIGNLNFGDTDTATAAGWLVTGNTLTLAGGTPTITVGALGTGKVATVSSILAGTSGLTKTGAGTLSLTGINTYTGGTIVDSGNLTLGSGGITGVIRGALTINEGASVTASAKNWSFGYSDNNSLKVTSITVNGGSLNFQSFTGDDSGGGFAGSSIVLNGGTIAGPFGWYRTTTETTLQTLASSNQSTISGGIFLRLNRGAFGSGPLTFNVADGTTSDGIDLLVSGAIADSTPVGLPDRGGRIVKTGAGTMVLSATNTYANSTTIAGGKLTISSTGSINGTSGVTIGTASTSAAAEFNYNSSTALTQAVSFAAGSTGGTLSGNGTINQAVSVTSGNTLAIGNSVGQMNFGSTLALAGTTIMEIDGTAGAGLTGGNDFANVTGGLTYGGILTLDMGAIFSEGIYSWNLFDFGSETGTFSTVALDGAYTGSLLDGDADGIWNLIDGDNSWVFTESTGVLGLTVIPEPSAALLGSLGMLCLLRRRR